MLTRTTFISLLLTTSSLRIQQKEKATSRCPSSGDACPVTYPITADTGNPDSTEAMCHKCMCYLEGYRQQDMPGDSGYTLGACGPKVQVKTAVTFQNHMYGCAADYMKLGHQATDGNNLARGRWSDLFDCVTSNVPISNRAVVNPLGVNPYWLDPVVQGLRTAEIQNAYVSKKIDYPGSLPTEDCSSALSRPAASWVTVCDSGTHTFDGIGRCCISMAASDIGTSMGNVASLQACKTAIASTAACAGKLSYFFDGATNGCRCNVVMKECGVADDPTTDLVNSDTTFGGHSPDVTLMRQVQICA